MAQDNFKFVAILLCQCWDYRYESECLHAYKFLMILLHPISFTGSQEENLTQTSLTMWVSSALWICKSTSSLSMTLRRRSPPLNLLSKATLCVSLTQSVLQGHSSAHNDPCHSLDKPSVSPNQSSTPEPHSVGYPSMSNHIFSRCLVLKMF